MSVYIDDIMAGALNFWVALAQATSVCNACRTTGFRLSLKKTYFLVREVVALGFVFNINGKSNEPEKVDKLGNWLFPKTAHDLVSMM